MKLSSAILLISPIACAAEYAALADVVAIDTRPYWLIDQMKPSAVKDKLAECARTKTSFSKSDFSIGHRGACMQYPEHTIESYKAAALMGAGIIECDVTFTKDLELICRHAQCDLHTTTDVVLHPELNAKCTVPFETGVEPKCCASDFTLDEIRTLCGKMDSSGSINATTPEEYVFGGTADWRTDLYQYPCPTIPTHKESIELIRSYHGKFTPELKAADVEMPFEGTFTQENYAQKMIDEYVEAGVEPSDVWPQSFNHLDVIYWVENTDFGGQAVALHEENSTESEFRALHSMLKENGVKIVAPPLWMLVEYDNSTELGIVPSAYSDSAKENGLAIITWTLERTPPGLDGWYWQTLENMTRTDGDNFALLHVLSQDVGVIGVFSDWPATTTFYANCMDLGLRQDGSGSTSEGDASAQASPAVGKQRHLSAASQFVNIALKLAGI